MVHVDISDGGAGLAIGVEVGQLIIVAKRLPGMTGTDSSGDIIFLRHDIVPDPVDRLDICGVAGESGHVGHTGIHIDGTHGMTHGLILINNRFVGLAVGIFSRSVAATVEEIFRLVEIFSVAGGEIEFGERHLRYLMPRHAVELTSFGPISRHTQSAYLMAMSRKFRLPVAR